ncbi:5-(carboxyamino)imidazole ribonucleotide synthase [Hyphobacterium sp. HN65]|uniref:N5-carboxyaminoimidazole ribonucleotide synthase n=1 Tax=Hyphobacterium lacteum TaxID=3116575 RepID=A0ABU7LQJ4_9PROT|nr:5-(carboxyamino)imidazole ribonucleotide synthase [Hyphobacterium sp. HN65]MEE2525614.1 5-(carboxyamino)imidazole ribonucleotide synthase [Hyphobacterium sp. HN65]
MTQPLAPGSVIGILGGGQLGRMLATAAAELGFDAHIFDPESDCPAGRAAARVWSAPWDDDGAIQAFAGKCDVITFEWENVPASAIDAAESRAPVRPGRKSLELTQDRLVEKSFIREAGCQTVDFAEVNSLADLENAVARIGRPSILKTRRFGYDGKGQAVVKAGSGLAEAWASIGGQPAILEAFAPFQRELSVVAARTVNGDLKTFPLAENQHSGGILRVSTAPAQASAGLEADALKIAEAIGNGLEHVGVFAVELFDVGGQLIVNEIAPRVHNSGHWTMDACACGQFEQHIRAVAGWPLGNTAPHSACEMTNLIGEDVSPWLDLASEPDVCLHLYGKRDTRPGRKMGHINRLFPLER